MWDWRGQLWAQWDSPGHGPWSGQTSTMGGPEQCEHGPAIMGPMHDLTGLAHAHAIPTMPTPGPHGIGPDLLSTWEFSESPVLALTH